MDEFFYSEEAQSAMKLMEMPYAMQKQFLIIYYEIYNH